jgi:hypothetical protein
MYLFVIHTEDFYGVYLNQGQKLIFIIESVTSKIILTIAYYNKSALTII